MPYDFESFEREVLPSGTRPQLTIQRRGTLSINRAAFEALGSPSAVELLYDASRRILGLRPTGASADNAYAVHGVAASPNRHLIAGAAFTKHHGIPTDISRRWFAEIVGDVLAVDLNAASTEVTSNRRGTGSAH